MGYKTDTELLQQFEYFTVQFEKLLLSGEDFVTAGNQVPFAVHLNNSETLEVVHTNNKHQEITGHHIDQVREMGLTFLLKHIHPESMAMVTKELPPKYANISRHQTFMFVQYVRLRNSEDFSPVITFTKPSKLPDGRVVCLSLLPGDFGPMSARMEQIVQMDQFKLKHFDRFRQLSAREVEVLTLLAEGLNNPEIAKKLFLSRETIETHRKHLIKKLEINSYRDLIKYAIAFDLISF